MSDAAPRWLSRFDWRGAVVPAALLVAAEIAMAGSQSQSSNLAAPSAVARALYREAAQGTLFRQTGETLLSALMGLGIGGGIGIVLGVLFGLSRRFDRLMMVTVESIRPIPSAALIPIVILAFGFGYRLETFLTVPAATFPILVFTRSAVAGTEPRLLEFAQVIGLGRWARVAKIILPAALPRIFVGFRLSAALALVVAVTVEVVVNPQGLGSAMMVAEEQLHPATMYATVVWLGFVGWGVNAVLLSAQHRLFGRAGRIEGEP
jgi:ABC-type nitrate/sulfonate/bicarbonate transport system permease component